DADYGTTWRGRKRNVSVRRRWAASCKSGVRLHSFVYLQRFGQLDAEYTSLSQLTPLCSGPCYPTLDHIGSVRMVTDQNAAVVTRHDYLPFGEEILAGTGGRTSQWTAGNSNVDQIPMAFTGQIRDRETGLDYFGARYYGSALGRWTSPDA